MSWDPARYEQFAAERSQPFFDLLALCAPVPGGTAVDLGCGTGRLTAELHRRIGASATLGIDRSPEMLAPAPAGVGGLTFCLGDLAEWEGPPVDLVFANASMQWVDDHPGLLARLRRALRPGGQLAFAVPANFAHPSHRLAREVAAGPPFSAYGLPADRSAAVLAPERYAEVLDGLGADDLCVRLQVYGHRLASTEAVVDWVSGTLLTPYRERMDGSVYQEFVARYRAALLAELGDRRPYFYAFARLLAWARFS